MSHSQDIRLLLHRYNLLVNEGRMTDYTEAGSELVAFLLRDVHHRSDVKGTNLAYAKALNLQPNLFPVMCVLLYYCLQGSAHTGRQWSGLTASQLF